MQNFVLRPAREIVRLATITAAVACLGISQDADPNNWALDIFPTTNLHTVAMPAIARVDAGCSRQYLALQLTLSEKGLQFDSSTNILVRVDGRPRMARLYCSVSNCEDEKTTRAIFFVNGSAQDGLAGIGALGSGGSGSAQIQKNVNDLANSLFKLALAPRSAGTLAEAYQASLIELRLPLATGASWVEVHPQDPSFRQWCPGPGAPSQATRGESQPTRSKEFHGTVDEFLAALPGLVQLAAQEIRLDPQAYRSDIEAIQKIIRTCAAITPEMVRSVKDRFGLVSLKRLGAPYEACAAGQNARAAFTSAAVRPIDSTAERGIEMYIHGLEDLPAPFYVGLSFTILPNDQPWDRTRTILESPTYIVGARIRQPR